MSIKFKPLSKDRVEKLFSEPIHRNEFKIRNISEFIKEPITAADVDYLCPIKVIYDKLAYEAGTELDNNVVKAVQRYAIDVDKDELFKALAYDRDQYNKGFADGFKAGKKDRWIAFPGPDMPGKYIVTYESGEVGRCYWGSLKGVFCWQRLGKDITHEVLAWMENPEPYKEAQDND